MASLGAIHELSESIAAAQLEWPGSRSRSDPRRRGQALAQCVGIAASSFGAGAVGSTLAGAALRRAGNPDGLARNGPHHVAESVGVADGLSSTAGCPAQRVPARGARMRAAANATAALRATALVCHGRACRPHRRPEPSRAIVQAVPRCSALLFSTGGTFRQVWRMAGRRARRCAQSAPGNPVGWQNDNSFAALSCCDAPRHLITLFVNIGIHKRVLSQKKLRNL